MSGVRRCAALGCLNTAENCSYGLFKFPSDTDRSRIWIRACNREDLLTKIDNLHNSSYRICGAHFSEEMFANNSHSRLRKNVNPIIFPSLEGSSNDTALPGIDGTRSRMCGAVINMMRSQTVDERTQTAACLSEGSPRKKKLRKTVKQLRNEVDYLKKKTTSLKRNQECKSLPKVTLGEYKQLTYKFCPSVELAKFINVQISQITKKPRGRRYSPSFKNTCLSLYFEGPKLYRKKLTKMFCLPSFTTLSRFIKHVKISPGVDDNVFSYLEKKVAHFSPLDKNCIVCIDEVSLKANLFYAIDSDKILGFEDFGDERTFKPAMNATVVMIRGLCKNWKQPLSYVLVNSVCPARKLEQLLKKNIERLQCIGLNVLAVVCDMGSNNIKLSKNFQITAERPFFLCGNKEVAFIFDAPHLLKALRNNLLKYDFFLDGNPISWRFIEQFYNQTISHTWRSCAY
nr:unnamed protein product [Callosobruchus chinensis]